MYRKEEILRQYEADIERVYLQFGTALASHAAILTAYAAQHLEGAPIAITNIVCQLERFAGVRPLAKQLTAITEKEDKHGEFTWD